MNDDRCPSCEHSIEKWHRTNGCWLTIVTGTPGRDSVCPCSVAGPDPAPGANHELRRLEQFILSQVPGQPDQPGTPVDTAIRLIRLSLQHKDGLAQVARWQAIAEQWRILSGRMLEQIESLRRYAGSQAAISTDIPHVHGVHRYYRERLEQIDTASRDQLEET